MADNDAIIEQLRKDNEDLRRQLGDMTTQLERLTTLFMEQRPSTTAGPSVAQPPEQPQTRQGLYDPYGIPPQHVPPVPQGNQAMPSPNSQPNPAQHDEHDSVPFENQQTEQRFETIMNRLNSLEGAKRTIDPTQYCIVSDIEIPKDFKVPDFEKYDGTSDPQIHISMYYSKMGAYLKREKMLMYFFQESLTGPAMRWYLNLNKHEIKSWEDLIDAFLTHYQHNMDLAPDKSSLRVLTPNKNENFRAFAQRWRNLAAQINPPMTEKELIDEFMNLKCLDNKIKTGCATALTFSNLVTAGIRVETSQGNVFKSLEENSKSKKKEEIYNIGGENSFNQSLYRAPGQHNKSKQQNNQYQYRQPNHQQQQSAQTYQTPRQQPQQQRVVREPLPVSQSVLFKHCAAEGMLAPRPARQFEPPFPRWYDTNAYCDFHSGVQGHSTENCFVLRNELYGLIEAGRLKLINLEDKQATVPNVGSSNVIEE